MHKLCCYVALKVTSVDFTRVTLCVSAVFATATCLSIRLSVTPSIVLESQRLPANATYAWAVDITCQYYVTGSLLSAVEPSLLQARRSVTLYQTVSETWRSAAAASGNN